MQAAQHQAPPSDWRGIARQLGPGLIISANIVGSGELIVTTKVGADVGFILLWFIILGCMIVGGILGFSATQSDIDFITSKWIYGSIVGSFLLSGWAMNYQRDELMKEINELKDRVIELELASKKE